MNFLQKAVEKGKERLDEHRGVVSHSNPHQHIQEKIRRHEVKCRGVNLGGWLVAEQWMTWDSPIWKDVPGEISAQGEFATMKYLGHEKGDARFREHRDQWITEQDIADIAAAGLNTVRVSVGYWIVGFDHVDPPHFEEWKVFAPGGLQYLDRLIHEWAYKYNVAVLISMHAAKGSQNGRDHSAAPTPNHPYWGEYSENVESTIQAVSFLAERYKDSPAFLGLAMLNEPEYPVPRDVVEKYYQRVYQIIRHEIKSDCVLTVCPMLTEQGPGCGWENFMPPPEYQNIWHEWHRYFKWGYEGMNESQLIEEVKKSKEPIKSWTGNWLYMGEWSLGTPDSAPFQDPSKMQEFAKEQLKTLSHLHSGWTFWSWKVSDDNYDKLSGWSFRMLLKRGIIKL